MIKMSSEQIEQLAVKLPWREKIRLVRKLEQDIWGKRMDQLLKRIDERRKKHPISSQEIKSEIDSVRWELYGPRHP